MSPFGTKPVLTFSIFVFQSEKQMNPPVLLKPIIPYLKHAEQLEKVDPLVAYFCLYHAINSGVKLRQTKPDEETKKYLLKLMDQLDSVSPNYKTCK